MEAAKEEITRLKIEKEADKKKVFSRLFYQHLIGANAILAAITAPYSNQLLQIANRRFQ